MADIKRTVAQEAAVTARGRSLMISAAAGSGKTATLTQRIISLITDSRNPADISSMLIVTFTRKAAGELRQRITDALNRALAENPGNRHLAKQLTAVGAAPICTIDSYYLSLVRENFQKLGLPSSFRMADEAESAALALETADRIIENKYENDEDFSHLADTLASARSEEKLASVLIRLHSQILSLPGGVKNIEESAALFEEEAQKDFFLGRTGKAARSRLLSRLKLWKSLLDTAADDCASLEQCMPYLPAVTSDLSTVNGLLGLMESESSYADVRALLMNYAPETLGRVKKGCADEHTEAVKEARNNVKDGLKALKENEFALDSAGIARSLRENAALDRTLCRVIGDFDAAFMDAKNRRMITDFSDLARFTLKLLDDGNGNPTETALSERRRYSHIFVDEYQDTSAFQDRIFNLISNGKNLFIVGDVKQSIYSFRGARPDVFSAYRGRWPLLADAKEGEPGSIYMSENFRCAEPVINFTNLVCGKLFSEAEGRKTPGGGIGYRREDDLIFSKKTDVNIPVEFAIAEGVEKPDGTSEALPKALTDGSAAELDLIICKIKEIAARRGCPEKGFYAYEDIAVLARSSSILEALSEKLAREGIPYCNNAASSLFDNPEVELFYSLLCSIDNPMRDTHLTGALRSPVFGFTLTDLLDIRMTDRGASLWESLCAYPGLEGAEPQLAQKCRNAQNKLTDYRYLSEEVPVDRFIRLLWTETGAAGYSGADPGSSRRHPFDRQSNLRQLYDFARSYQSSGYRTLHDFVRYISDILENGTRVDIAPSPSRGAVSLMTVHKSKGLEFPAVILAGTSSKFNRRDSYDSAVFCRTENIGPVFKLTDPTGLCIQETPMRLAVSGLLSDLSDEEEIRVLYVALTRAKEELYITCHGPAGYYDKLLDGASHNRSLGLPILETNCWADWIAATLSGSSKQELKNCFCYGRFAHIDEKSEEPISSVNTEEIKPVTDSPEKAADGKPEAESSVFTEDSVEKAVTDNAGSKVPDFEKQKEKALEKMRHALNFRYPYAVEAAIPAKLSVSKLYPDLIDDAEKDVTLELDNPALADRRNSFQDSAAAHGFTDASLKSPGSSNKKEERIPAFTAEGKETARANEKGTATHLFLQFCNFASLDGTAEATEKEISRLLDAGFIDRRSAALIRRREIDLFARSRFFREVRTARMCERERRFNIMLPAVDFTQNAVLKERLAGEQVLVQGVIDLVFENADGKLILCDYKTDRLPEEIRSSEQAVTDFMKERHSAQLAYYSEAVLRLWGRRPDHILLFPLAFGEAVNIM